MPEDSRGPTMTSLPDFSESLALILATMPGITIFLCLILSEAPDFSRASTTESAVSLPAAKAVMTAFAAGKLTADSVVEALEKSGASDKIKHKKIVIPGMVARMSAKLNEKSGREVIVGPRESSGIPKFLKNLAEGQ